MSWRCQLNKCKLPNQNQSNDNIWYMSISSLYSLWLTTKNVNDSRRNYLVLLYCFPNIQHTQKIWWNKEKIARKNDTINNCCKRIKWVLCEEIEKIKTTENQLNKINDNEFAKRVKRIDERKKVKGKSFRNQNITKYFLNKNSDFLKKKKEEERNQ